jgi:hypothetical protein
MGFYKKERQGGNRSIAKNNGARPVRQKCLGGVFLLQYPCPILPQKKHRMMVPMLHFYFKKFSPGVPQLLGVYLMKSRDFSST